MKSLVYQLNYFLLWLLLPSCCLATAYIPNFDFRVTALDPTTTGFTITGDAANLYLGTSISTAGDINNDGYDDILLGSPYDSGDKGIVYVIYGGPQSGFSNIDLASTSLNPTSTGFFIKGNTAGDKLGISVSTAGDVNNDGYDDIIIGAFSKSMAYVIYGGPTASMTNIDLASTTLHPTSTGFTIKGEVSTDGLGYSVSTAGDFNKDGFADIIVSAPFWNAYRGKAYVVYGTSKATAAHVDLSFGLLSPTSTGFAITGDNAGDNFGQCVSTAGDIDNDGYADIIVSSLYWSGMQGGVYVIYGRDKSLMTNILTPATSLIPTSTGFLIEGENSADNFGFAVSTAGDVNKDGYSDIIIGAPQNSANRGAAYIIYGGRKAFRTNANLASGILDPTSTGFKLQGNADGDHFGYSVSRAGDMNGDGYSDVIVGAYQNNGIQGKAYVIYGKDASLAQNFDFISMALDPASTGFTITGEDTGEGLGFYVSAAGDVNKDGYGDVMVASPYKNSNKGRVYLIDAACLKDHCEPCTSRQTCDSCSSPYVLYQSECISSCPSGTFTTTDRKCQACPTYCTSCTSSTSCQSCLTGFTLANSLCSMPSSSNAGATATQTVASAVSTVGSVVSVGNSIFPIAGLVSEIVQNTRYLNLSVTAELAEVYKTFSTDLISWNLPNFLAENDGDYKPLPDLFAKYNLDSPFLVNFWSTMMTMLLAFFILVSCLGIQKWCFAREKSKRGFFSSLVEKAIAGSINFIIVQAYGCLDNILFYFVLDVRTNPFDSAFSRISFAFGIVFIICGSLLMLHSIKIVLKYHVLKQEGLAKNDMKELENHKKKNEYWTVFYGDFSDADPWSQCFMAFMVLRSNLSSLVLTILYAYPLMQTLFLIILDGAILIFMLIRKPFTTLRGVVFQYFFELVALVVHLCTFILSFNGTASESLKSIWCTAIIYMNAVLVMGGLCFMSIEIHETVREKINEWKQRKASENTVVSLPEESEEMIIQRNNISVAVETGPSIKKHQVINISNPRNSEICSGPGNEKKRRIRPLNKTSDNSMESEVGLINPQQQGYHQHQQRILPKPVGVVNRKSQGLNLQGKERVRIDARNRLGLEDPKK